MTAPVLPNERKASARPRLSSPRPTMMDESGFWRVEATGDSPMPTACEASTMRRLGGATGSSPRSSAPRPTRMISSPGSRAASSAPWTVALGA